VKYHIQSPLPDMVRKARAPQKGQSLVEFAMVVPLFLAVVFSVIGFGILLENKIALNDAARNGARFAAAQPWLYDAAASPSSNSIEGIVRHSGSTITIPNDDSHIQISFWVPPSGSGTLTECGYYTNSGTTVSFTSTPLGTYTKNTCITRGNVIRVDVTGSLRMPVPIVSAFFPNGITIKTNAAATVEQSCSTTVSANCT
jgi:Flp pilus assembly protein TadG